MKICVFLAVFCALAASLLTDLNQNHKYFLPQAPLIISTCPPYLFCLMCHWDILDRFIKIKMSKSKRTVWCQIQYVGGGKLQLDWPVNLPVSDTGVWFLCVFSGCTASYAPHQVPQQTRHPKAKRWVFSERMSRPRSAPFVVISSLSAI